MSMTVSNGSGRVSVLDLPTLGTPAAGDTVIGVQGGVVGRFSAASLSSSPSVSSVGSSPNNSAASVVGYGYYNNGNGTFVQKPIYQLFLTLRSPGGTGTQGTITFPDGFEFMDVPHVALQSCDLSASDFANGGVANPVEGSLGTAPGWLSVTNNSLGFKYPDGWQGSSTGLMIFVLTGFRKG